MRATVLRRAGERRRRGTSTVEMAIVLPLLLLLVFAIGEFGVAFTQWQTLANAAREGARTGVVFRGGSCDSTAVKGVIQQTVQTYADTAGLDASDVSVSASGECAGSGNPLTVVASAPHTFQMLPGLAGLQSQITLRGTSVMRNE